MTTLIPTCDLCDAHKNDTDGAFRVLPPRFRHFGKRCLVADSGLSITKRSERVKLSRPYGVAML